MLFLTTDEYNLYGSYFDTIYAQWHFKKAPNKRKAKRRSKLAMVKASRKRNRT